MWQVAPQLFNRGQEINLLLLEDRHSLRRRVCGSTMPHIIIQSHDCIAAHPPMQLINGVPPIAFNKRVWSSGYDDRLTRERS